MELQRKESKEFLDDLTVRDQRMMLGCMTIVHLADSLEELVNDTEALYGRLQESICVIGYIVFCK